jgi:hypothetical protein
MKILSSGVQRTEEEKVFTVVRNVDADSITTGMGVRYVGGVPAEDVSADGVQCVKLTVADDPNMLQFAGIAAEDIPADGYGLVQNFGIVNSVMMSHVGSSITIGTFGGINNTLLRPGGRAGTFFSGGPVTFTSIVPVSPLYNRVQAWQTVGMSAQAWSKGFVRVL